jgi:hypothetical protein
VPNLHDIQCCRDQNKIKHKVLLHEKEMHPINLNVKGKKCKYIKFKLNIKYIAMLFIKYELALP